MELVRKDQPAPLLTFLTKKEDFCAQLAVLCNIQPKGTSKTDSFSECGETRTLRRLLKEDDWLHPILPFSAFMNPILPTDGYQQKHEAFSDTLPTIREFVDKFVYMPSLMKPKKVPQTNLYFPWNLPTASWVRKTWSDGFFQVVHSSSH